MPNYFTKEYVANLAVRNLLSEVGRRKWIKEVNETQWKKLLNELWGEIKKAFNYSCVYCGAKEGDKKDKLERDHLIPTNKETCGLNHPGNIVPSCRTCNNRYHNLRWEEKLSKVCSENGKEHLLKDRKLKIKAHLRTYKYPKIQVEEEDALRKNAKHLYETIIDDIGKANKKWEDENGTLQRKHNE